MRSKMVFVCLLAIAVALSPLFSGAGSCQEKDVTTKATQSRGGGPDENIKSKAVENNPNALPPAPPEKGGDKSRGPVCYLTVDNYTPWRIQIYIDGEFVGMVSAWGKADGSYPSSTYRLYGVADFTSGDRYTFGPRDQYCNGPFTWTLQR
jgi:hypothetical protein